MFYGVCILGETGLSLLTWAGGGGGVEPGLEMDGVHLFGRKKSRAVEGYAWNLFHIGSVCYRRCVCRMTFDEADDGVEPEEGCSVGCRNGNKSPVGGERQVPCPCP